MGKNWTGFPGFGPGQEKTGVNLIGNGIGCQDRLVFLGSFRAHQVFEVSVAKHDPRSEVQPPSPWGRTKDCGPSSLPARVGLRSPVPACWLPAALGGPSAGRTRRTARSRAACMIHLGGLVIEAPETIASIKHLVMSPPDQAEADRPRVPERRTIAESFAKAGATKKAAGTRSGGLSLVFDQTGFVEIALIGESIRRRPTGCPASPLPLRG